MTCLAPASNDIRSTVSSSTSIKKNVSFNGRVRVRNVQSLNDFSDAECNAAWYSCQDFRDIKSRERQLRDASANSESLQQTLRKELGMETPLERRLKHARIDVGRYSVLCEQQRQVLASTSINKDAPVASALDSESLASVLRSTSMESMTVAVEKARSVAKQVQRDTEADEFENKLRNKSQSAASLRGNSTFGYRSKASFKSARNMLLSPVDEDGSRGSKSRNSNVKWTVTANTSLPQKNPLFENAKWSINPKKDSKMAQPTKKKYDLSKLAGLVGVPQVRQVPVKILQ